MKFFNKYIFTFSLLALGLLSCETEVELDDFSKGTADFSNYVALGNSLTSGYADNSLYLSAQQTSFPALMAEQFATIGGGSFNQPLVSDEVGGLTLGGNQLPGFNPRLELTITATGLSPTPVSGTSTTEVGANISSQGPFNNLGVPGAKSFHLLSGGYGSIAGLGTVPSTANPYYVRFSKPNTSIIADAVSQNPTFFTLWIGNNDVLGYATSGGSGDVITPVSDFQNYITLMLQSLRSGGAEGVVANIPNVTDIPFFNTVPLTPIELTAAQAAQFNAGYAAYNGGLAQLSAAGLITADEVALRTISFQEGFNAPVFIDNDLTDLTGINPALVNMRKAKFGELITLTASGVIGSLADPNNPGSGRGLGVPLGGQYVLTTTELSNISSAVSGYNAAITSAATQFGIPVADMNSFFGSITDSGILFNGASYTVEFVRGGLFSLDGVHPTPKGYALMANQFLSVINDNYNANVPMVDINNYTGVKFP